EAALALRLEQARAQLAGQLVAHDLAHALPRDLGELLLHALRDAVADRVLEPVVHLIELVLGRSPLVAAAFAAPALDRALRGLDRILQSLPFIHLLHY